MSASPKFKPGDWVVYVPNHANGDVMHADCERGTVASVGETSGLVFVRYGAELHAKATSPGDLIEWMQYFFRIAGERPSSRQPPHSGLRTYLGDGLFADFDGHNVVLSAENGVFSHDTVYVEPSTLESFNRWHAQRIAPLREKAEG